MSRLQTFRLPGHVSRRQLINTLSQQFSITPPVITTRQVTFFDTFDWRLYHKALVAYTSNGTLFVRKLNSHQFICQQPAQPAPKFAAELPAGPLKALLAPVIDMRALLPQATAQVETETFGVLNHNQKTVARLAFETVQTEAQPADSLLPRVWLLPLRGYARSAEKLAAALAELGLTALAPRDLLEEALAQAGQTPGHYSTRLEVPLQPKMRSDAAAKAILGHILPVIKLNEAGVKQDIDTEFLHDFRVAIRRTRSVLSQLAGVFPPKISGRFRQEFGEIARTTNNLRDLDVYLLNEAGYRALLPDVLATDIAPLFDYLRRQRAVALSDVMVMLDSESYAQTLRDWQAFLAEPEADTPVAAQPVIDLARRQLKKRYRRVARTGQKILKNTQDEQLHALRIECKKLRYLLEFFAGLFPAESVTAFVKQLKKLQDNLGDFNDLCVQEEYLLKVAENLPAANRRYQHSLLAIGSLVGALDRRRAQIKNEFAQTFTDFAAADNKNLFKTMLLAGRDGV